MIKTWHLPPCCTNKPPVSCMQHVGTDAPLQEQVFLACPLTDDLRQTDLAMIKRGRELKRPVNQPHRTLPGAAALSDLYGGISSIWLPITGRSEGGQWRSDLNIVPHSEADARAVKGGHRKRLWSVTRERDNKTLSARPGEMDPKWLALWRSFPSSTDNLIFAGRKTSAIWAHSKSLPWTVHSNAGRAPRRLQLNYCSDAIKAGWSSARLA